MSKPRETSGPVSPIDLRLRLIMLALEPALSLAQASALSLDDLQALVATSYFRQMRRRGLSLRAVARRMHKSLRTIATLSKRSSQARPFLELGNRITLRRKLAAYLTKHSPVDEAKLRAAFRDPRASAELDQLCAEGIVTRAGDQLVVSAEHLSLVGDDLERRLDSVRHLLEVVTHTLEQRFSPSSAEAFARVLSFCARRETLSSLRAKHYEALRDAIIAADREAGSSGVEAAVVVCVAEMPKERTPLHTTSG